MLTTAERRKEILSGAGVSAGGLFLLIASFRIAEPARSSPGLGPSVLPTVVSAGLILCGLILILTALRGKDTNQGVEAELLSEEEADLIEEQESVPWLNFGVILGLMVLYAMVFIPLGFILSTTIFLTAVTTFVHPATWLRNLIFAAALSTGAFYLFREVLSVILPAGVLG